MSFYPYDSSFLKSYDLSSYPTGCIFPEMPYSSPYDDGFYLGDKSYDNHYYWRSLPKRNKQMDRIYCRSQSRKSPYFRENQQSYCNHDRYNYCHVRKNCQYAHDTLYERFLHAPYLKNRCKSRVCKSRPKSTQTAGTQTEPPPPSPVPIFQQPPRPSVIQYQQPPPQQFIQRVQAPPQQMYQQRPSQTIFFQNAPQESQIRYSQVQKKSAFNQPKMSFLTKQLSIDNKQNQSNQSITVPLVQPEKKRQSTLQRKSFLNSSKAINPMGILNIPITTITKQQANTTTFRSAQEQNGTRQKPNTGKNQ